MEKQSFERGKDYVVTKIDGKGRCCGRKPIVYKRSIHHTFCCRCHRAHDPQGNQIDNWAWTVTGDVAHRM